MNPALALALAIAAELVGTTALKLSDGFSNYVATGGVVVGYLSSFYFLGLALEALPIGKVYAIWSAVGIVGTTAIGLIFFGESLDLAAVVGVGLIIVGIVLLATVSGAYTPAH
jgi:small multidrug resistance pump